MTMIVSTFCDYKKEYQYEYKHKLCNNTNSYPQIQLLLKDVHLLYMQMHNYFLCLQWCLIYIE